MTNTFILDQRWTSPLTRRSKAAKLQAGDAATTSIAFVGHREPFSVEVDGDTGSADGD